MAGAIVQLDSQTAGYEVRPGSGPPGPGVMVVHEIMGLVDYVKGVADSFAEAGFTALAVDFFEGKTAAGMEDGAPLRDKVTEEVFRAKMGAGIRYLKSRPYCSGKLGVMGFCMGGGFALWAACLFPQDFQACSVFYGRIRDKGLLKNLKCPVMGNFGAEDKGITTWAVEELDPEMKRLGKRLDMKIYPGAPHGFHRYTTPHVHRPDAAKDAFQRTLGFFAGELKQVAR